MSEDGAAPDERPWMTKSQLAVALGKSSRTIDLYVKAGRVERMQDGSRAYFRVAAPGNGATGIAHPGTTPEVAQLLAEIRDELRALRADNAELRAAIGALPPAQLPVVTPGDAETTGNAEGGNEALPGNAPQRRRGWLGRLIYGPE